MEATQTKEARSGSRIGYLLVGLAAGAVLGLLYAPKSGEETRSDLADLRQRNREKFRNFVSKINDRIPSRIKTAAAYGAVKEGATEAAHEVKENATQAFR